MQIQCKIHRLRGTVVALGSALYTFLPENDNVAEVSDPAHIELLLSIPEG
ncbi:MAG: hypothetical protein ACRC5A_12390 [Enterobacteriaceae bacterium]